MAMPRWLPDTCKTHVVVYIDLVFDERRFMSKSDEAALRLAAWHSVDPWMDPPNGAPMTTVHGLSAWCMAISRQCVVLGACN